MDNQILNQNRGLSWFVMCAVILAFFVVMLGAYTRLVDAGLGCPDWPVCYGQVTVPHTTQEIQQAAKAFPGQHIEAAKAWTEMVHRYFASTLGFLILIIAGISLARRRKAEQPVFLPVLTLALVIFQGLLGMWTVTLLLQPTIVMGHLLGGFLTLSLLFLLFLKLRGSFSYAGIGALIRYRPWAILGLIIVFVQIILGGWTSANYAGLSCPDFPFCQGHLIPAMNFHHAFDFWPSVGPDYQGGLLSNIARVTINTVHRFFGLFTGIYVGWLTLWMMFTAHRPAIRRLAALVFFVLIAQVILGVLNVALNLPLSLAVAHNGVGALLLVSTMSLVYSLFGRRVGVSHYA